ncbi:unnamed protein product [Lymnaea stagnalis]|uniref:Uncharacterized protein n=1 Tax=Lymnaea stagnalis TaxID=6523 RepID=A0AAV2IBH8_LYMST
MEFLRSLKEATALGLTSEQFLVVWNREIELKIQASKTGAEIGDTTVEPDNIKPDTSDSVKMQPDSPTELSQMLNQFQQQLARIQASQKKLQDTVDLLQQQQHHQQKLHQQTLHIQREVEVIVSQQKKQSQEISEKILSLEKCIENRHNIVVESIKSHVEDEGKKLQETMCNLIEAYQSKSVEEIRETHTYFTEYSIRTVEKTFSTFFQIFATNQYYQINKLLLDKLSPLTAAVEMKMFDMPIEITKAVAELTLLSKATRSSVTDITEKAAVAVSEQFQTLLPSEMSGLGNDAVLIAVGDVKELIQKNYRGTLDVIRAFRKTMREDVSLLLDIASTQELKTRDCVQLSEAETNLKTGRGVSAEHGEAGQLSCMTPKKTLENGAMKTATQNDNSESPKHMPSRNVWVMDGVSKLGTNNDNCVCSISVDNYTFLLTARFRDDMVQFMIASVTDTQVNAKSWPVTCRVGFFLENVEIPGKSPILITKRKYLGKPTQSTGMSQLVFLHYFNASLVRKYVQNDTLTVQFWVDVVK